MSKKGIIILVIILVSLITLCLCCSLFFLASTSATSLKTSNDIVKKTIVKGDSNNQIALIDIQGMIISNSSSYSGDLDMVEEIIAKLDEADSNNSVKAIILRINTPGGTVYDSDRIAKKVKQVSGNKPVVTLITTSATSGGYYIAAASDRIVASETSLTGSIGVVTQVIQLEGLYKKLGIDVITITNTQADVKTMKDIGIEDSKDRKVLEKVLNDYYEEFVQVVENGRPLTKEEVQELADGSIFSGKEAQRLKLVDSLGGLDEAINETESLADIKDAQVIQYDTYIDPFSSLSLFFKENLNPIKAYTEQLNTEPGMYLYYLPE